MIPQKTIGDADKEIKILQARINELKDERFILIATIPPITVEWKDSTTGDDIK